MTAPAFEWSQALVDAVTVGVVYGLGVWRGVKRERRAFAAAYGEDHDGDEGEPELDPAAVLAPYSPGDLVWVRRETTEDHKDKRHPRTVVDVLPDGLMLSGNPVHTTDTDPNCFFYSVERVARDVRLRRVP